MHLLATIPGTIPDGSAAVDLAQTPGDIVVLSSADTELALLAAAQARRRAQDPAAPRLRLASILRLGHNFSVDLYMETVAGARLVIARLLGGSAYWPYGVERLVETCRTHGIPLALLPGDDKPDAEARASFDLAPDAVDRAVALSRRGRPRQCREFPALCRIADRARCNLGRARTVAARRALLARSGLAEPRRDRRRNGAARAASCRSSSTGRSCNPATPRRSTRWSARSRRGVCGPCRSSCRA